MKLVKLLVEVEVRDEPAFYLAQHVGAATGNGLEMQVSTVVGSGSPVVRIKGGPQYTFDMRGLVAAAMDHYLVDIQAAEEEEE